MCIIYINTEFFAKNKVAISINENACHAARQELRELKVQREDVQRKVSALEHYLGIPDTQWRTKNQSSNVKT